MKKILLTSFLFIVAFWFPTSAKAQSRVGVNMSSDFTYEGVQNQIKGAYGGNASATLLIDTDCATDITCLQSRAAAIQNAGIINPILRISSSAGNAMTTSQAIQAANAIAQVFPGKIVEFGNEVNNISAEWKGGTFVSYRDALVAFADTAGSRFQVMAAALDPYFDEGGSASAERFIQTVYSGITARFNHVKGLAFNVYQSGWDGGIDCPADNAVTTESKNLRKTRCSWIWLQKVYESVGLNRSLLILTEYSLAPGEDGDVQKIISFIDTTKQTMLDRGITYITPLIKNSCTAIAWPWLLWADGTPSRILDPNNGTDLSRQLCGQNQIAGSDACTPQASTASTSSSAVMSFFTNLLASFFPSPPTTDLTAECAEESSDAGITDQYGRNAGKPFCDKPKDVVVTLTSGEGAKKGSGFIGQLLTLFFTRETVVTGSIPDLGGSDKTSGKDQFNLNTETVRGYLGGPFTPQKVSEQLSYRASTDSKKTPPRSMYDDAGAFWKLSPRMCKNITGETKPCQDALRDRVLAAIVRGYSCKLLNTHCDGEKTNNVSLGWVVIANEAVRNKAEKGVVSLSDQDTIVVDTQFTKVTRTFTGIEIACTNPNFHTSDISRADVKTVCNKVMGIAHAGGYIYSGTVLGGTFEHWELKSPPDDVKYGYGGAWYRMPIVLTDDVAAEACESINPGSQDPKGQKLTRCQPIGLPGVLAAKQLNQMAGDFLTPFTTKEEVAISLPASQCLKNAVGGRIYDPIAGAKFDNDTYQASQTISSDNVLGVTSQGQVLPAVNDEGDVRLDTPQIKSTIKRGVSVTMKLTRDIPDLFAATTGRGGWTRTLMPKSVSDAFDAKVGGVPVSMLPTAVNVGCGRDFPCPNQAGTPVIGGVLLGMRPGNSLVSELIRPYTKNGGVSVSGEIHKLAQLDKTETLTGINPWGELASFVNDLHTAAKLGNVK